MSLYEKILKFLRKKEDIYSHIKIPIKCLLLNGWNLHEKILIEIRKDIIIITKDDPEKMELYEYTWLEE